MTDVIQGTAEWFAMRAGKVTASRVADVIAKTKTGWGAGRANYMADLMVERLTGTCGPSFTNAAMQWGTDQEPNARAAYIAKTGDDVAEIAFVDHPAIQMTGASPDGLVGDFGLIEIKCPNTATHIETLISKSIPTKYQTQMAWQMACTGRDWCDFVSYDPRLPDEMQLFVQRYDRDDTYIASLEKDVKDFLGELDQKLIALKDSLSGRVSGVEG